MKNIFNRLPIPWTVVQEKVLPILGLLLLVIALGLNFQGQAYNFYPQSGIVVELLAVGVILLVLCRMLAGSKLNAGYYLVLLLMVQSLCFFSFLHYLDGRLIYSDDHPNFLYRLQLLRNNFPHIPFYNPLWNAGYSAHEFYPSGIMNVFYVAWPLIYWAGDINSVSGAVIYNYIIAYVFLGLVPLANFWAARLFLQSTSAAFIAGILALIPSLGYLEWLLNYGTLGFGFSIGLSPLVFALAYHLAFAEESPRLRLFHALALFVTVSLALRWSLFVIPMIPLGVSLLLLYRQAFARQRLCYWALALVLVLAFNISWIADFIELSQVGNFVSGDTIPGSNSKAFRYPNSANEVSSAVALAWKSFRAMSVKVNPLILALFIPGVFLLSLRRQRYIVTATILWLLFIAAFGEHFKPQLELRRMMIAFSFIAILPVARASEYLLLCLSKWAESKFTLLRFGSSVSIVVLLGALGIIPIICVGGYTNRTNEKYRLADPVVEGLSNAISKWGGDGRTFFMGFILHDLGATDYASQDGGHVAPLAIFAGKPLYAFDYYHRYWSTVDPIPAEYRARGEAGIEEFLDLVNATAVITFKREWADYCKKRPWYQQVYQQGRFRLFQRLKDTGGYLVQGAGHVTTTARSILVSPKTSKVVLKYRYFPRLRVLNKLSGVKLSPVFIFREDKGKGQSAEVSYLGIQVSDEILKDQQTIEIGF